MPHQNASSATAPAGVRIGDADRERAARDLGDHFAAGRLTPDELDDRLGQAWAAKTAADLRPLFADLPGTAVAVAPPGRPVQVRGRRSGPPFRFPLPLLPVIALVLLLTVVTHIPFLLFFVGWFVLGRVFGGYRGHQPYALRR